MRPLRIEESHVLRETRVRARASNFGRPQHPSEIPGYDRRLARRADALRADLGIVVVDGILCVPDDWSAQVPDQTLGINWNTDT